MPLTKTKIIEDYCIVIKKIINYLYTNSTNNKSETYRNRALIFVNNTPGMVLESTGPILFNRNKTIQQGNSKILIEELIQTKNTINTSEEDTIYIISNIIDILMNAPESDKTVLIKDLQYITKLYIQFLILEK